MAKGTAFRNIRARELRVQSAAAPPMTSRLQPLAELNTAQSDSFAWVSPDGLRIYFTRQAEPHEKPQTYGATRTSADAPFGPAEYVSSMRHATMSGDELYIVGIDGNRFEPKLHHARRNSVNSDFAPTTVIEELADQANPKSPWLGSNGLNMVFQRKDSVGDYPGKVASDDRTSQTEFVVSRRPSLDSKWSEPRRLPLLDDPLYSDALTWPSISEDGLTLFFCNGGGRFPEVMYATRMHRRSAFGSPRKVAIDGKPLLGRAPRYVEATRELFVTRYSDVDNQSENWDLWVVKDFVPDKRVSFQGHLYQFVADHRTWKEARDECKRMGGHLVVIDSAEENAFVARLISAVGWSDAWIGITDEATEGQWLTVDSKPVSYTNWFTGQPNDKANQEHFALMTNVIAGGESINWRWSDQPNQTQALHKPGFVCEWDGVTED
jgi:hypothetical protein